MMVFFDWCDVQVGVVGCVMFVLLNNGVLNVVVGFLVYQCVYMVCSVDDSLVVMIVGWNVVDFVQCVCRLVCNVCIEVVLWLSVSVFVMKLFLFVVM